MATLEINVRQANADFQSIKTAIVEHGVVIPDGTPTSAYAEKIGDIQTGIDTSADTVTPEAMRSGVTAHNASGQPITGTIPNYDGSITEGAVEGAEAKYNEGVEAGKKTWYDSFWDMYQNNGERVNYEGAFGETSHTGAWGEDLFRPKYDLVCTSGAKQMFFKCKCKNIKQALESAGVVLDTSNAKTHFTQMFQYAATEETPFIDMSDAINTSWAFGVCNNLISMHIKVSETTPFNSSFNLSYKIKSLTVDGTIGQNGFDVSYSPLNKESLTSIVNALSSTATGLTVTLRLAAVNTAFETSTGANDGSTSDEWLALAATKPNWTINLINS